MKYAIVTAVLLPLCVASAIAQPETHFLENKGQWNPEAKYLLRAGNTNLWITDSGMIYDLYQCSTNFSLCSDLPRRKLKFALHGQVVRLSFLHTARPQTMASNSESGTTNYFIGTDPSKWVTGARSFGSVTIQHLYDGVDAVFSLDHNVPRYDLVVQPGFDPAKIEMRIEGADSLVSKDGNELVMKTSMGNIEERGLFAYQEVNGAKQKVDCQFQISSGNHVSFQLGAFDRTKPLVIDPLIFSTYLGAGDNATAIAVDRFGNSYVTGWTGSQVFPVTPGAYQKSNNSPGGINVFIAKLNANGTALVYATFLGGSGDSWGYGPGYYGYYGYYGLGKNIAIDSFGNAYITGGTGSKDFPTTPGAFQRLSKATNSGYYSNAFVSKLNATGTALLYSTYLGGSNGYWDGEGEWASGIAVDSVGEAYVIGSTSSSDFPVTSGALQTKNPNFSYNIEVDGRSAFVTKLNARGSGLIYSTYLGGSKDSLALPGNATSIGTAIAVDPRGDAFVAGHTVAMDFPVTSGAFQSSEISSSGDNAFVAKLNPAGSVLLYSTFLGDTDGGPIIASIAIDTVGEAFVTGTVYTTDFPVTAGAYQTTNRGKWYQYQGQQNAFVTKLNAAGSALMYSTYLGGTAKDGATGIAIDSAGDAFVAGAAWSLAFPTLPGAIQT